MAKAFILSYDLHGVTDKGVYANIDAAIAKQFPDSEKILNTTFVIVTSQTDLHAKFKAIFDYYVNESQLEFYFSQMAGKGRGWLIQSKWDKLNSILAKVAVYCS